MNVFQQIFAEVSPNTNNLLSATKENVSPNDMVTETKTIKQANPTKTNKPLKKETVQKEVIKQQPVTKKVVQRSKQENLQSYHLSQQEAEIDRKIAQQKEEIAKAKLEAEQLRKALIEEKEKSNALVSDNQLIQSYLDNAETYEQKRERIMSNYQKQVKEREQYWNNKILELSQKKDSD